MQKTPRDALAAEILDLLALAPGPESTASSTRCCRPGAGPRGVTPEHRMRAVDALLTGLHEPGGSHPDIVAAAVPGPLLERAHAGMLERGHPLA